VVTLSGCASFEPDKMYDGDHPLSDTTVLSAFDDISPRSVCTVATLQKVDDNWTSRGIFPAWVRVKPGTHSFVIHCSANFSMGYYTRAELSFSVPDMKPRHIYVARYQRVYGGVRVKVDDLGENSNYKLPGGKFHEDTKAEF